LFDLHKGDTNDYVIVDYEEEGAKVKGDRFERGAVKMPVE